MRVTSNPAGCPTCTAFIGEPCTTRTGNLAARPHQARLDAQIPLGRHTHDCRANAATAAAENIAEWDDATQAEQGTNPVYWADQNLDDQTSECICWPARRHALINQRIRKGWMILAEHEPTTTYTTIRVDPQGNTLTGEPTRRYQTATPAMAAGHAAHMVITGPEYWSAKIESTDETPDGGTWTYTPSIGSPVHIRVTTEPDDVDQATHAAEHPTVDRESTVVGYVTIDPTNANWAPALALSAALDAAEPADDAPEPEIRTCTACGEPIEFYEGIGWVEVAPDGHYDLCPERYDEATNTELGHVVDPEFALSTGGVVRPAISTKDLPRGLEEARTKALQPYFEQGAEPRSRHALPGTYTV